MLKRHLKTAYNMTPEEYRARWRLPPDYPMVAPAYAEQQSKLAKKIGLGSRSRSVKNKRYCHVTLILDRLVRVLSSPYTKTTETESLTRLEHVFPFRTTL